MLFGGGLSPPNPEKGEEAEDKPTISTENSKIKPGKRKHPSCTNNAVTLESKDSNVSIELRLTGYYYIVFGPSGDLRLETRLRIG